MSAASRLTVALLLTGSLVLFGCNKPAAPEADKHEHAKEAQEAHTHDHGEKAEATEDHGHDHGQVPKEKDEHGHEHGHDDDSNATARFEEGHGLELAAGTATAIGLTTARAERRSLSATAEITATVFDAGPPARASALVPLAVADAFAADPRVLATHRDTLNALGQIELVVAAPERSTVGTTLSLQLRTPARDTLGVPNSAVLRTATGVFIYVQRGEHWLRTPVTTGAAEGGFTAITDGLADGETVAVTAVEHLWLTELRLTKGGGHSH